MVLLIRKGLQRCCWVGCLIRDEIVCGSSCGSRVVDDRCICCDGMVSQGSQPFANRFTLVVHYQFTPFSAV